MFRETGSDKEQLTKHWLIDLMERPNLHAKLAAYALKYRTFSLFDLDGEVFWHLGWSGKGVRRRSTPPEFLTIFRKHEAFPVPYGGIGEFLGWEFQINGVRHFADRDDVVHFANFDPLSRAADFNPFTMQALQPNRGRSPLDSKRLAVATDLAMSRYNRDWFNRSIASDWHFTYDGDMTQDEQDDYREKLTARVAGKNGEVILTANGWTASHVAGASQHDAQFSEGRKQAKEEQLAGLAPPVAMGETGATFTNTGQQMQMFYEIIVDPALNHAASTIDVNLLEDEPDLWTEFATDDVDALQAQKRERFKSVIELSKAGWPIAVACRAAGVDVESFLGSDIPFRLYSEIPVSDILAGSSKAEVATVPPKDAPKPPDQTNEPGDTPPPPDAVPRFIRVIDPHQTIRIVDTRMAGPFDYGSTQINLTGDVAKALLALGATIPDDAIAEKGRESDTHITVKFGLDPKVTARDVTEALANSDSVIEMAQRGGGVTFGETGFFAPEGKDYDVVFVGVDSPDLVILNQVIREGVETTGTQPEYIPHATVAYVTRGRGAEFDEAQGRIKGGNTRDAAKDKLLTIVTSIIRGDDAELQSIAERFHVLSLNEGARQIADLTKSGTEVVGIDNQYVKDFLAARANLITSVNETTAGQVLDYVKAGLNAGDSPEEIASVIREVYNVRKKDADFIAKQENGSALNGGRFAQTKEEGSDGYEWISSRDKDVRESHAPGTGVDGEVVALGEQFSNGCRYPQDEEGPVEEVMGCRCTAFPASLNGARMLQTEQQRAIYWRATMVTALRNLNKQFASRLGRYFNDQRGRVLAAVAKGLEA